MASLRFSIRWSINNDSQKLLVLSRQNLTASQEEMRGLTRLDTLVEYRSGYRRSNQRRGYDSIESCSLSDTGAARINESLYVLQDDPGLWTSGLEMTLPCAPQVTSSNGSTSQLYPDGGSFAMRSIANSCCISSIIVLLDVA